LLSPRETKLGIYLNYIKSINYVALVCKVLIKTVAVDYGSEDWTPDMARKMGAKVVEVGKPVYEFVKLKQP